MVVWSKDAGHTPRISDGWCGVLSIYTNNEFTTDAHNTSAGSLLRELLPSLSCPCSYLSTASVSAGYSIKQHLCMALQTRRYKYQPRDMLNQLTKLTSVLLEDSGMSTLSSWAISRSLQHDFLKDREHLIMSITCLHIHHVPHCTQTHIWSMHTEILIERDDVKYKLIVRYSFSVLWKITLGILFLENANLEAISKGQPWQPVNCPLSLETNISGLEGWGKMFGKPLEKRPCQSKTHSGLNSLSECQISVKL